MGRLAVRNGTPGQITLGLNLVTLTLALLLARYMRAAHIKPRR